MALDYWFDGQLRRYWMQFVRVFSGFQYESGVGADGTRTLKTIPAKLGTKDRQVNNILRNNSENTILSTPSISCQMTDLQPSAIRRQDPNLVRTMNVWERAVDPVTNKYTGEQGKSYSVERFMPVPYDMTMRMDLWTSNELQKHQIMEQILILFNPSIDLQTGDNPLDWGSLGIVELDSVTWTNRELPIGTDDDIEIASLTFKMPIWLSPPAKVKRQNIIQQIVANIGVMDDANQYQEGQAGGYAFDENDFRTRVIITPGDHQCAIERIVTPEGMQFEAVLLGQNGSLVDENKAVWDWTSLIRQYGQYRPGISQFRIKTNDDMDDHISDIVGTFGFYPNDANKLWWQIDGDTLPKNTMPSVDAMISLNAPSDPVVIRTQAEYQKGSLVEEADTYLADGTIAMDNLNGRWPGDGVLPDAVKGQRYLLHDTMFYDPTPLEDGMLKWDFGLAPLNPIPSYDYVRDSLGRVLEKIVTITDSNTNRVISEVHYTIDAATGTTLEAIAYPKGLVIAEANDIIEFDGSKWIVSFDASSSVTTQVVTNTRSQKQLRWTGGMWVDAIAGHFNPGYWRIFL